MDFLKKLHHAVVPSKSNNHHPHLLRHNVIITVLVFAILIEATSLFQSVVVFRSENMLAAVLPGVVASLTNDARTQDNLNSLAVNPLLTEAAQNKAVDMATKGYFSHISPDGELPWQWIEATGYQYQYAGENLAVNFTDSSQLVNAWMASPEHRANILKPNYTEIGIGMATGTYQGQEAVFVVQYFASPETTSAPTPPVPSVTQSHTTKIASTTKPVVATASSTVPAVLGASTQINFFASPRSTANDILLALLVFFLALFILGGLLGSRLHHPSAIVNTLVLVVILLALLVVNKSYIFGAPLNISSNTQHAAVIQAF